MTREAQHEALYRRWRPRTFGELIGQEHVSRTLANAVKSGRVAHAYLFCGPRGTGKTSTARILAKALNCQAGPTPEPCGKCRPCIEITEGSSLDVAEIDAASYRQVDETQEVLKGVHLAPAGDLHKIYIVDEVHMLSTHSFNALLKTLEEPPEHVIFVLATTEPHRVLPTVLSRCQRFDFHRVPVGLLVEHLRMVADKEEIAVADEALSLIARRAQGSVRDALGSLEQLAGFTGGQRVEAADATRLLGLVELDVLVELVDQLNEGRIADALRLAQKLSEAGRDARSFIGEVIDHLRRLFLLQNAGEAGAELSDLIGEDLEKAKEQAGKIRPTRTVAFLEAFGEAYERARGAEGRLVLEMAIVKLSRPVTDSSLDGILHRLERVEAVLGDDGSRPRVDAPVGRKNRAGQPEAPKPETPEPVSDELARLRDSWDSIMERVKKNKPAAGACLMESKPVMLEKGKLVLEFGPRAAFHRDRVEREYSKLVVEAVKAIVGIGVTVECRLGEALDEEPKVEEPKVEKPALSIEEIVGFVTDEFDAKIVEESGANAKEAPVIEEDE